MLIIVPSQTYLSSEELDDIDGLLTTKVIQLINVSNLVQSQHGGALAYARLDSAFIFALQQFRKAYIGEAGSRTAVSTRKQLQLHFLDILNQNRIFCRYITS